MMLYNATLVLWWNVRRRPLLRGVVTWGRRWKWSLWGRRRWPLNKIRVTIIYSSIKKFFLLTKALRHKIAVVVVVAVEESARFFLQPVTDVVPIVLLVATTDGRR
jgi:hypothetical protein